jgi:ribonuclease HI
MTLCKNKLQNKAIELQKLLKRQGVNVFFNEDSFKDYLVKLTIKTGGDLLIYYKPTKDAYSLKKQLNNSKVELNISEIETIVDSVWNKINGSQIYSAESGVYEAFVDGAYISGITGYGAVIYLGENIKTELSGTIPDTKFRQFGGELKSVIEAIKWCKDNAVKKVRINYDYQGIEKFATGKWKAGNELSQKYVNFILKNAIENKVEIEWRHIKSHTGNAKNDRADALAKKAAKSEYSRKD